MIFFAFDPFTMSSAVEHHQPTFTLTRSFLSSTSLPNTPTQSPQSPPNSLLWTALQQWGFNGLEHGFRAHTPPDFDPPLASLLHAAWACPNALDSWGLLHLWPFHLSIGCYAVAAQHTVPLPGILPNHRPNTTVELPAAPPTISQHVLSGLSDPLFFDAILNQQPLLQQYSQCFILGYQAAHTDVFINDQDQLEWHFYTPQGLSHHPFVPALVRIDVHRRCLLEVAFFLNGNLHHHTHPSSMLFDPETAHCTYLSYHDHGRLHQPENMPAEQRFFASGTLSSVEYRVQDQLHRTDGPALVRYHANGNPHTIQYCVHGLLHHPFEPEDPTLCLYSDFGDLLLCAYHQHDQLHRAPIFHAPSHTFIWSPAHVEYDAQTLEPICQEYWYHDQHLDGAQRDAIAAELEQTWIRNSL